MNSSNACEYSFVSILALSRFITAANVLQYLFLTSVKVNKAYTCFMISDNAEILHFEHNLICDVVDVSVSLQVRKDEKHL